MTAQLFFTAVGLALCLFALGVIVRRRLAWSDRQRLQVQAEVVAFRSIADEGVAVYSPVYRFSAEGGEHEVTDAVYSARPKASLGDKVWLTYPDGRPDLACVPRPGLWLMVSLAIVAMAAILAGKALGWLH